MPREERPLHFEDPDGFTHTGFLWPAEPPPAAPEAAEATGGAAAAPVEIVFLPGNGFPVQAYRPALAGLGPRGALHALNPRGHGGSTVPERLTDWDGLLGDLRAYVEQRTTPPVLLAGHSMGAMLSLRLAAEAPRLVAGLLLLEPPLRLQRGQALPPEAVGPRRAFIDRARNRRAAWASRAEAEAWFAGSVVYRLWTPEARAGFLEAGLVDAPDGGVVLATPPWLEADLYETVPQQELYAWAEQAACAGVLFRGLESAVANAAAFEELAEALPVGVVVPLPGTHTFPMEHPAETVRRLTAGLRLLRGETGLALTAASAAGTR